MTRNTPLLQLPHPPTGPQKTTEQVMVGEDHKKNAEGMCHWLGSYLNPLGKEPLETPCINQTLAFEANPDALVSGKERGRFPMCFSTYAILALSALESLLLMGTQNAARLSPSGVVD